MRCSCSYFLFHLVFFFVISFTLVAANYRASVCNDSTTFYNNSRYSTNLNRVMDDLRRNASQTGYNTSSYGQAPNKVYGLLQCIGKISGEKCSNCLQDAKTHLETYCGNNIGGLVWMDDCFLRYDNYSFISKLDTDHASYQENVNDVSNDVQAFKATKSSLLSNLSTKASDPASKGFAAASANFSSSDTVYGLAQCWRDISTKDCRTCLMSAIQYVESCCSGKQGVQRMLGSCTIGYEIYPYLDGYTGSSSPQGSPAATPSTASTPPTTQTPAPANVIQGSPNGTFPRVISKKKSSKQLAVALGVVGGVIVAIIICLIAMNKKLKSGTSGTPVAVDTRNEERREYTPESEALMQEPSFIFNLQTLVEATENFHEKNKLGEGGFGAVYKGRIKDGEQIAVKKLFAKARQGNNEFLNEVKLVANVQHRNLVKLRGCCAEGDERLLVYEYLPKKSLDTILFNPEKRRQLDWQTRYNIILGVARGLLYLHEDSQLRIIHRDIKANNILLDDKLNAKIADFGLARLFGDDDSNIQTRVAGTLGYMAPEYAMRGQLSAKADVYSYGVLLLEILSGRKNIDNNFPPQMQNLLEWAWRLYRGGDILNMVDTTITEACPNEQVVRCIHVGLLCVQADATARPAMSNVLMMMMSNSVTLSNPTKPAFVSSGQSLDSGSNSSLGSGKFAKEAPLQTSAIATSSSSGGPSVNETSITELHAR